MHVIVLRAMWILGFFVASLCMTITKVWIKNIVALGTKFEGNNDCIAKNKTLKWSFMTIALQTNRTLKCLKERKTIKTWEFNVSFFLLKHSVTKTQGRVTIGWQMLFPITYNMVVGLQTTKWVKWIKWYTLSHKFKALNWEFNNKNNTSTKKIIENDQNRTINASDNNPNITQKRQLRR